MEHLVVLPARAVRRLKRQRRPLLVWSRRRREPPVGAVRARDRLLFKIPGGDLLASASVTRVAERFQRGRYTVRLRLKRIEKFPVPFPVVKRDRRSWVVCPPDHDLKQQSLLSLPGPTLDQLVAAVRQHQRRLPRARDLEQALKFMATQRVRSPEDVGALLLLTLLLAWRLDVQLSLVVRRLLRGAPSRVYPLAVFKKVSRK